MANVDTIRVDSLISLRLTKSVSLIEFILNLALNPVMCIVLNPVLLRVIELIINVCTADPIRPVPVRHEYPQFLSLQEY